MTFSFVEIRNMYVQVNDTYSIFMFLEHKLFGSFVEQYLNVMLFVTIDNHDGRNWYFATSTFHLQAILVPVLF